MRVPQIRLVLIPKLEFAAGLKVFELPQATKSLLTPELLDHSRLGPQFRRRQLRETISSEDTSCSRSISPALERKMRGEALTTAVSATL